MLNRCATLPNDSVTAPVSTSSNDVSTPASTSARRGSTNSATVVSSGVSPIALMSRPAGVNKSCSRSYAGGPPVPNDTARKNRSINELSSSSIVIPVLSQRRDVAVGGRHVVAAAYGGARMQTGSDISRRASPLTDSGGEQRLVPPPLGRDT